MSQPKILWLNVQMICLLIIRDFCVMSPFAKAAFGHKSGKICFRCDSCKEPGVKMISFCRK